MSIPISPPPLEEIVKAAETLPAFPDVVWKVLPLVQRMAPVSEIEAVIKLDQATTARILSLSRSAAFSRRKGNVTSLQEAIVALGEQQLLQVIMTACSAQYYQGKAEGYDLREGELWEHAVAVALMAEMVARSIGLKKLLSVYTSGLLHDIGRNILNRFTVNYFDTILSLVKEKKICFVDAEREALGMDHQQLGGMVARNWHFPPEVITAISCHHNPLSATEHKDVVSVVYAANRMVSALGIGCGVDGFFQPNNDDVFLDLGLNARVMDKLLADLVEALGETKQFLAL